MFKHLLVAWENQIKSEVHNQVKAHIETPSLIGIGGLKRAVWSHVCGFINNEIQNGDMIAELYPFATAYANERLKLECESVYLVDVLKEKKIHL